MASNIFVNLAHHAGNELENGNYSSLDFNQVRRN